MNNGLLLWIDDEIELLKAHVLFLKQKGYEVITVSNSFDGIEQCKQHSFDLILLDEMMPGITGLETLQQIKEITPSTPVVMLTKSEEEDIMNQAIGSKIADYLIKPVNPNQIILSLKKNIHRKEIETEVTQMNYQQSFLDISTQISNCSNYNDWIDVYKRLVRWELDLSNTNSAMSEMLSMQKEEANNGFTKYVKSNYIDWVNGKDANKPLMSPEIFKTKLFPLIDQGEKVFLLILDNLRFDQWKALYNDIALLYDIDEDLYMSILPTATQYARNAIFSGLMPMNIAKMFPHLWVEEDEDEGKNQHEEELIATQIERYRRHDTFSYFKANDSTVLEKYLENIRSLEKNHFNVLVINFVDMLSHARTESKMVRELASDEQAYRSLTLSWFKHSAVSELLKQLSEKDYKVIITTDHGSIRTNKPVKIIGKKNINSNLRYKFGNTLAYNQKEVFCIKDPQKALLPSPNISTEYVFATGDSFFAYPNNFNHYVSYYKNTFQHGGISMEEMLVPLITLTPKNK